MKTLALLLFVATAGSAVAHHLERVWTDDKGRKTKAELLKIENNQAVLLLPDGREVPFPIEKLSRIDQAFIEKFELGEDHEDEKEEAPLLNFEDPWPSRVTFEGDPEIQTIKEDADEGDFIYESANYRYNCDVRLSQSVVKGFAVMFEATHQFVREMPLAINGGKKKDGKYQIYLFERESAYTKAGGRPEAPGFSSAGKTS